MTIISYIDLTPAQEHAIEDIQHRAIANNVSNGDTLDIIATFKTFQGQELKITLDKNGVITHAEFTE